MDQFLQIGIVGVVASIIVEAVTRKFGTSSFAGKLIAVAVSVVMGVFYVLLAGTPIFQTIVAILASASAVYALFFKRD